MNIALSAFPRLEIEFEIRITARRRANMIEGLASQRRASEIGVQNYAGGINDRQQRVAQRLSELAFNCRRQAAKREVERFLVRFRTGNSPSGNFLSQPRQTD